MTWRGCVNTRRVGGWRAKQFSLTCSYRRNANTNTNSDTYTYINSDTHSDSDAESFTNANT